MTTKYFISLEASYASKNKLQLLLIEKSKGIVFTLCDSLETAKEIINGMFNDAVAEYQGSAIEPEPDYNDWPTFIGDKIIEGCVTVRVTSCLKLKLSPVLNNQVADLDQWLDGRLQEGRHYLMGVQPEELTVADALEAFGFGRNGLRS